jgi:hypothetical protein
VQGYAAREFAKQQLRGDLAIISKESVRSSISFPFHPIYHHPCVSEYWFLLL